MSICTNEPDCYCIFCSDLYQDTIDEIIDEIAIIQDNIDSDNESYITQDITPDIIDNDIIKELPTQVYITNLADDEQFYIYINDCICDFCNH